jgi:hypothetical protein
MKTAAMTVTKESESEKETRHPAADHPHILAETLLFGNRLLQADRASSIRPSRPTLRSAGEAKPPRDRTPDLLPSVCNSEYKVRLTEAAHRKTVRARAVAKVRSVQHLAHLTQCEERVRVAADRNTANGAPGIEQ